MPLVTLSNQIKNPVQIVDIFEKNLGKATFGPYYTHHTVDCDQPYDVDFSNVFKALHSAVHSKAPLL